MSSSTWEAGCNPTRCNFGMSLSLSRFFIFLTTILFSFSLLGISTIDAAEDSTTVILEELPGIDNAGFKAALKSDHPGEAAGYYINGLLTLGIALATVLAVLMITIGGFQYITTDSFMQKSEGKKRIQDSLMGLGLILVSYLLLGTINSDLLKIRFGLSPISLEVTPLNIKVNIEDTITAAVRENNKNVLDRCKKGNTGGGRGRGAYNSKDNVLKNLDTQIRELEGYKKTAEDARSDYTHVAADLSSQDPDAWYRPGQYDGYSSKGFFKNSVCGDFGGGRSKKSSRENCSSIGDYISFIDGAITKLNRFKNECENA